MDGGMEGRRMRERKRYIEKLKDKGEGEREEEVHRGMEGWER